MNIDFKFDVIITPEGNHKNKAKLIHARLKDAGCEVEYDCESINGEFWIEGAGGIDAAKVCPVTTEVVNGRSIEFYAEHCEECRHGVERIVCQAVDAVCVDAGVNYSCEVAIMNTEEIQNSYETWKRIRAAEQDDFEAKHGLGKI